MNAASSPVEGLDENIGANLKSQRERLQISQAELARLATDEGLSGFHQTTIARIEKGDRPLRAAEAVILARVLDTNLEFLAEGKYAALVRSLRTSVEQQSRAISDDIVDLMRTRLELADFLDHLERGEDHMGRKLDEKIDPVLVELAKASLTNSGPPNWPYYPYVKTYRDNKIGEYRTSPGSKGPNTSALYDEIIRVIQAHPDLGGLIRDDDGKHPEAS